MGVFSTFFELVRAFWEVFLAVARFQIGLNELLEGACSRNAALCGFFGIWLAAREVLLLLGILFWAKLAGKGGRILL